MASPAKFTSVNIKHCVSIVIWRGIWPHAVFILFLFLPTVWRQGNHTFPPCWCWMEFLFSMTLQSRSYVDIHQNSTRKKWAKLKFWPNCPFVWFCLELLELSVGLRGGKTATVRLRQCKTIPNSKLQTSCYKDRFMGVPLKNFMPFGGSPERLVIDHHPERFLEIVRKKKKCLPKYQSLKLYHNSFLSLAKQFWPQTKFQTTHNETFLWMTFVKCFVFKVLSLNLARIVNRHHLRSSTSDK